MFGVNRQSPGGSKQSRLGKQSWCPEGAAKGVETIAHPNVLVRDGYGQHVCASSHGHPRAWTNSPLIRLELLLQCRGELFLLTPFLVKSTLKGAATLGGGSAAPRLKASVGTRELCLKLLNLRLVGAGLETLSLNTRRGLGLNLCNASLVV